MDRLRMAEGSRSQLPVNFYSAEQSRQLDAYAINTLGIPAMLLMERAGRACFARLCECWPNAKQITVLAGKGNNAGDGYVIAALAHIANMQVMVLQLGESTQLQGEAAQCFQRAKVLGVPIVEIVSPEELLEYQSLLLDSDVLIDALLGTGIQGPVRGLYASLITMVNELARPVLAVDVPSGLCPDTGQVLGKSIRADVTLTFISMKLGLMTGCGPDYVGKLYFDDLHLPISVYGLVNPLAQRLDFFTVKARLPQRCQSAHKGLFGHVLVLGGDRGMAGAVLMAASAAARMGAGLVSLATRSEHCATITAREPVLMCHGLTDDWFERAEAREHLQAQIDKATTLVLGPGLGQSPWAEAILRSALAAHKPTVIDADALNLLSEKQDLPVHDLCVLTPHPKEASRLLNLSVTQVQQNRFFAVTELAKRFNAVIVLKGAGTLISDGQALSLASVGGPAMATGGMGDILSGMIAALLAQGLPPYEAAQMAVVLHGRAADKLAAEHGLRGLLATDLLPELPTLLNALHG